MRASAKPAARLDRWGLLLLGSHTPPTPYGHDFAANDLTLDEESVCPRCLHWISPGEIVRRTAFGPAQHEACPLIPVTVT